MSILEWLFAATLLFGVIGPIVAKMGWVSVEGSLDTILSTLMVVSWPYLCFFVVWRWV